MSMNRIDQYPGRGSGNSCRAHKNPVNVTAAAASQLITPTARSHSVDPDDNTMTPTMATTSARYPTRKGPDRHPPVSVVLQFQGFVHARYCAGAEVVRPGHYPRPRTHSTRLRVSHRPTELHVRDPGPALSYVSRGPSRLVRTVERRQDRFAVDFFFVLIRNRLPPR